MPAQLPGWMPGPACLVLCLTHSSVSVVRGCPAIFGHLKAAVRFTLKEGVWSENTRTSGSLCRKSPAVCCQEGLQPGAGLWSDGRGQTHPEGEA